MTSENTKEQILFVKRTMFYREGPWNEGLIITTEGNIYQFDISKKYISFTNPTTPELLEILNDVVKSQEPSNQCDKKSILEAYELVKQIDKNSEFLGIYDYDNGYTTLNALIDDKIVELISDETVKGAVDCPQIYKISEIMEKNGIFTADFLENEYFHGIKDEECAVSHPFLKDIDYNEYEINTLNAPEYHVNVDDYKIVKKLKTGKILGYYEYEFVASLLAVEKASQKEVSFHLYNDNLEMRKGKINDIVLKPNLFKLKGTVNVFKIQTHFSNKEMEKIKEALKRYAPFSRIFQLSIVVSEMMKIQRVEEVNAKFISSKGGEHEFINPTIRSKMIFGIASIMKRLHKNDTYVKNFFGKVCLDDKLEPRIKLPSYLYFDLSKVDLLSNACVEENEFHPCDVEFTKCTRNFAKADVYSFSFFLYSLFTDTTDEKDFTERFYRRNDVYRKGNFRPKKRDSIPDNYWNLINKCWDKDPNKRPCFEEIVEILRNDDFALNEYSMNTNIDELHEYQNRIDSD